MLLTMISIFIDLMEEPEFNYFTIRETLDLIEYVLLSDDDDFFALI